MVAPLLRGRVCSGRRYADLADHHAFRAGILETQSERFFLEELLIEPDRLLVVVEHPDDDGRAFAASFICFADPATNGLQGIFDQGGTYAMSLRLFHDRDLLQFDDRSFPIPAALDLPNDITNDDAVDH